MIHMILLMTALAAQPIYAHEFYGPVTDDSDLSSGEILNRADVPIDLPADRLQSEAGETGIFMVRVVRETGGNLSPIEGLRFSVTPAPGRPEAAVTGSDGIARLQGCTVSGPVTATARFEDSHFSVINGNTPYRLNLSGVCGSLVTLSFRPDSHGGQALGIWQVVHAGKRKLEESVGLGFWNKRLPFVWPASGDFYSMGTVSITRGDHWDVVGHEMGHGIYDLAKIGAFGGGPHKIDECYSDALALSEGWASYFSAWVSLDLSDPDARFEFLVPRRAPIRIEHVPADVCNGPRNEWRVSSFFWDVIDLHDDGESSGESFARVWKALANSRVRSASEAAARLTASGFDRGLIDVAWLLNFRTASFHGYH